MSKFKVGDKVRLTDNSWGYVEFPVGTVGTITSIKSNTTSSDLYLLYLDGAMGSANGMFAYRFELVEPVSAAALTTPVVPQLPGIPDGFRAVRIGTPAKGEWYVQASGVAGQGDGYHTAKSYTILEKIDQPVPVEPAKPEAPVAPAKKVAPVFKVGDKVRLVDNTDYEKFPIGSVANVVGMLSNPEPAEGSLLTLDGVLKDANGMFAYRFELVTESPDDLVIQDRVPARAGVDFGWNLLIDEFDKFVPGVDFWPINSDYAGRMHGGVGGRSGRQENLRLAVMCYHKDLPELPTAERVVLDEYLVWDTDGPKYLLWSTSNPTIENDSLGAWDHAYPTGNTREIEVSIVKP